MSTAHHTPESSNRSRVAQWEQRWLVPVLCLLFGLGYVALFLSVGKPGMAIAGFAIMAGYGLVLVFTSRRSETTAVLRGEISDERRNLIHLKAASLSLHLMIPIILANAAIGMVESDGGGPWALLAAVGGAAYIGGTFFYSRRT